MRREETGRAREGGGEARTSDAAPRKNPAQKGNWIQPSSSFSPLVPALIAGPTLSGRAYANALVPIRNSCVRKHARARAYNNKSNDNAMTGIASYLASWFISGQKRAAGRNLPHGSNFGDARPTGRRHAGGDPARTPKLRRVPSKPKSVAVVALSDSSDSDTDGESDSDGGREKEKTKGSDDELRGVWKRLRLARRGATGGVGGGRAPDENRPVDETGAVGEPGNESPSLSVTTSPSDSAAALSANDAPSQGLSDVSDEAAEKLPVSDEGVVAFPSDGDHPDDDAERPGEMCAGAEGDAVVSEDDAMGEAPVSPEDSRDPVAEVERAIEDEDEGKTEELDVAEASNPSESEPTSEGSRIEGSQTGLATLAAPAAGCDGALSC